LEILDYAIKIKNEHFYSQFLTSSLWISLKKITKAKYSEEFKEKVKNAFQGENENLDEIENFIDQLCIYVIDWGTEVYPVDEEGDDTEFKMVKEDLERNERGEGDQYAESWEDKANLPKINTEIGSELRAKTYFKKIFSSLEACAEHLEYSLTKEPPEWKRIERTQKKLKKLKILLDNETKLNRLLLSDRSDQDMVEQLFEAKARIDETVEQFELAKTSSMRVALLREKYDIEQVELVEESSEDEYEEISEVVESRMVKSYHENNDMSIPEENVIVALQSHSQKYCFQSNEKIFPRRENEFDGQFFTIEKKLNFSEIEKENENETEFYQGSEIPNQLEEEEQENTENGIEDPKHFPSENLTQRLRKAHLRSEKIRILFKKKMVFDEEGRKIPDPSIYNTEYHKAYTSLFTKDAVLRDYKIKSMIQNQVYKEDYIRPILKNLTQN